MTGSRLPNGKVVTPVEEQSLKREAEDWLRSMLEKASLPVGSMMARLLREFSDRLYALYVKDGVRPSAGTLRLSRRTMGERDALVREMVARIQSLIYTYGFLYEGVGVDHANARDYYEKPYKGNTLEKRTEILAGVFFSGLDDEMASGGTEIRPMDAMAVAALSVGFTRLARTEVTRAWQQGWMDRHADATYYRVYRGSSYPCAICDEQVDKGWQELGHGEMVPFHPNCMCYMIFM